MKNNKVFIKLQLEPEGYSGLNISDISTISNLAGH